MLTETIAPSLAGQAEAAATALLDQGWLAIEHFVTDAFAHALRAEAQLLRQQGGFRAAGVGRGPHWRLDRRLRGDEVGWIDPQRPFPQQRRLLEVMERLRQELNRKVTLGLFEYEAHLAVYPPGSLYRRHRDHFRGTEDRVLTTTLYLNEGWSSHDGGQIRLFLRREETVEVAPQAGTLVLFLSQEFEHEVLTARRERWSWTGWFKQRPRA